MVKTQRPSAPHVLKTTGDLLLLYRRSKSAPALIEELTSHRSRKVLRVLATDTRGLSVEHRVPAVERLSLHTKSSSCQARRLTCSHLRAVWLVVAESPTA